MTDTDDTGATSTGRVRRSVLGIAGVTAIAGTVMVLSSLGSTASAAPDASVTLCHATASTTNPYTVITVNADSIETKIFGNNGHATHTGPVFDPAGGKSQPAWGDIIPSFVYVQSGSNDEITYPGMNLTSVGLNFLAHDCTFVEPPASSTPVEPSTPVESTSTSSSVSISASSSVSVPPATSSTAATSVGPIPSGVSAGLHTAVSGAGLKAWGTILMLLGGAAGLAAGLWPTRRRAH
jgi:hypothetical protein